MSAWIAFLRGINLGKRQMKMAELRAAAEGLGFTAVKTILASGNLRFETDDEDGLRARIEDGLLEAFDFPVKVILRRAEEVGAMIEAGPFAAVDPAADVACHVLLAEDPIPATPPLAATLPAHIEIARQDARELYLVAHRLPNGRYTEGIEAMLKALPKDLVVTMRNWNTVRKLLT